jgi:hypothetical protein
MSLRAWRRVYRWSGVVFAIAWLVKGIQLVRGADTDGGSWAVLYVAVFGVFLLCGYALRVAERRQARPAMTDVREPG